MDNYGSHRLHKAPPPPRPPRYFPTVYFSLFAVGIASCMDRRPVLCPLVSFLTNFSTFLGPNGNQDGGFMCHDGAITEGVDIMMILLGDSMKFV